MSTRELQQFIEIAPVDWSESLASWLANNEPQPSNTPAQDPLETGETSSFSLQTDLRTYEGMSRRLSELERLQGKNAMKHFAPFLGSLALSMLEGRLRAAKAMVYLSRNHSSWSPQAEAILKSGDMLLDMYDAVDALQFQQHFRTMCQTLFLCLLERAFSPQGMDAPSGSFAELASSLTWGPLEVAQSLFEQKFGDENSSVVRRLRADLMMPMAKLMQTFSQPASRREILDALDDVFLPDQTALNVNQVVLNTLLRLAVPAEYAGVALYAQIPAELHFREEFPSADVPPILMELVINAQRAKDPGKAEQHILVKWDERQYAIAIEDNGRGVSNPEEVWPFKLSEPLGEIEAPRMGHGLRNVRDRLRALGWKMTLASVPEGRTRFLVYPRLGDVSPNRPSQAPKPPSGPPSYGSPDAVTVNLGGTSMMSAHAGMQLYLRGTIPFPTLLPKP